MKIENTRRFVEAAAALVVGVLIATAVPALAGYKIEYATVAVTNANGTGRGSGSLASARKSNNGIESIGCAVEVNSANVREATCWARGTTGPQVSCDSSAEAFIDTAAAINSHSYIQFWFDAQKRCTSMTVTQGSMHGF